MASAVVDPQDIELRTLWEVGDLFPDIEDISDLHRLLQGIGVTMLRGWNPSFTQTQNKVTTSHLTNPTTHELDFFDRAADSKESCFAIVLPPFEPRSSRRRLVRLESERQERYVGHTTIGLCAPLRKPRTRCANAALWMPISMWLELPRQRHNWSPSETTEAAVKKHSTAVAKLDDPSKQIERRLNRNRAYWLAMAGALAS